MNRIPDFDDADRWLVENTLKRHFGVIVRVEPGDCEMPADPGSTAATTCPTYYWKVRDIEFVVLKIAANRYLSQFHYSTAEQFGSNRDFDDLADCIESTLRALSEYDKTRATAGITAAALP
jgi:hypothetical protein